MINKTPMAPTSPSYKIVTSTEVESHSHAIPGVQLGAIQTAAGFGPNVTRSVVVDDAILCTSSLGFPVRGEMAVSDDWVIAARISSAPPGTRWCGYDLEPGSTLLYAPGAEHTAVSPAGLEYSAAILQYRIIEEIADELQMHIQIPPRGSVRLLQPSSSDRSIASALDSMEVAVAGSGDPSASLRDVTHAVASELSGVPGDHGPERMTIRESRRIVRRCTAFVNDEGGRPSIADLCRVAFVSERRLRNAFVDAYGVPPMKYFRDQKLNAARNRLLATTNRQSVMEIAIGVGIENGGRFARRYFELFDELPSTTLHTAN